MATLARDKPRVFELGGNDPSYNEVPAIASDIIYAGAAVGESTTSGTGRPLVAGDNFMGFCVENCDNSAGAAAAKNIKVRDRGKVKLSVTGVSAVTAYDAPVAASDDDTFTLTTSGNTTIGKVKRVISGAVCIVEFEATSARSI